MGLPRAHQILTAEFENHLSGAYDPRDTCVHIRNCIAGDLECEQLSMRVSIISAELFQVIGYQAISVRQTHFCSYTLLGVSAAAAANTNAE
jgi:hypothetical protein